jgi:hypothetical protein
MFWRSPSRRRYRLTERIATVGVDGCDPANSDHSVWVVSFLPSPLAGDKWDQALLIGQFLQLRWRLANVNHHPVDL